MIENIVFIRNILYKCFFIGLLFYILSVLIWMGCQSSIINLVAKIFDMGKYDVRLIMLIFLGLMKIFLIYLFLVPALVFHWTGNSLKKQ